MARQLRIQYPGAVYHITSRGNAYGNIISIDISGNMDVKEKIVGQSILGKEDFIEKVQDRYLKKRGGRDWKKYRRPKGLRGIY